MKQPLAIVGSGLAGVRAAQTLRANGYSDRIILVGEEAQHPYERPALSKEALCGGAPPALCSTEDLNTLELDWRRGARAVSIDGGVLALDDGTSVATDGILLATGARARKVDLPGVSLPGVHTLRALDDAFALRDALAAQSEIVVIGGGLIGCEVASTARKAGHAVTVVESGEELMERALGRMMGLWARVQLQQLGVVIHRSATVASIEGHARARGVRLSNGAYLPADVVVLSVGAQPCDELAQAAGAACMRGVVVDAAGRSTIPGIFAAGDVASWPLVEGGRRSLESFLNSQAQAAVAACAMIGRVNEQPQTALSWTEIAGRKIQLAGDLTGSGEMLIRGDETGASFSVFRVSNGRVAGVATVDAPREYATAKRLVESRIAVQTDLLADSSTELRSLLSYKVN